MLLGWSSERIVVSFRGTGSWANVKADLTIWMTGSSTFCTQLISNSAVSHSRICSRRYTFRSLGADPLVIGDLLTPEAWKDAAAAWLLACATSSYISSQ